MGMKDDYLVVCPYYVEDLPQPEYRRIVCEGIAGACQVRLIFDDKAAYKAHKITFCRSLSGYGSCPVCMMLENKYK